MTTEQLHYFVVTTQEKSINAASKRLHISSQALSRTLINLEGELNVTLFERSRHGICLTAQGRRLLLCATQFLESLQQLNNTAADDTFLFDNPCSLLCSPGLEHFFPSFLSQIYLASPDLQINIRYKTYQHILDEIEQCSTEIALTNISSIDGENIYAPVYDDLLFYPLFRYYYYCIASIHSPLAAYKTVSCKTLLAYPLICIGEDLEHSSMSFIRKVGKPRKVIWESHFKLAYNMVSANLGVMLGYAADKKPLPAPLANGLANIALKENITSLFGYVIKKGVPLSRHTHEFIRFLNSAIAPQKEAAPMKI